MILALFLQAMKGDDVDFIVKLMTFDEFLATFLGKLKRLRITVKTSETLLIFQP